MELIHPLVQAYSERYTTAPDTLRQENEQLTYQVHPHAHMHSGKVQGQFLETISRMIQPQSILDIGTFTGYSALCLASGMPPTGLLHTIECREADADTAQSFFDRSDWAGRIILHRGEAVKIIPTLTENWDLVFIDADKVNYIEYYELTLPAVKPGGWILADNVLFHGQVLEEPIAGKNARAIQAFNDHVSADPRVEQVLLTIRDGLLLIRKR